MVERAHEGVVGYRISRYDPIVGIGDDGIDVRKRLVDLSEAVVSGEVRSGSVADGSAHARAHGTFGKIQTLRLVARGPTARCRVRIASWRREPVIVVLSAEAIVGNQWEVEAAAARIPGPLAGIHLDLKVHQAIADVTGHSGSAGTGVLIVAGANDHPSRRQVMLADAMFAGQGSCNIQVRDSGLRQFVETEDAIAVDWHPIRMATDCPAVLDPSYAAEVSGIACRQLGVNEFQAEALGDGLSDVGLTETGVSPWHGHEIVFQRSTVGV